jgi:uncharacterized membrane protein
VATELGDIKILIDVDVTKFEASLNNAMSRAQNAFNRMGAGMTSSVNSTLTAGFRSQYQAFATGLRDTFRNAFSAAESEQAQSMARLQSRMRQSMGSTSTMTQVGQSVGSSFAVGFSSPILNAIGAIHSAMYGLKDIGQLVGTVTGFTMAANLGAIQSGISALLKDTRQGAQITSQLHQLALESPFGVEDFAGIGRKMLAMGTPGNQLIRQMSIISDTVAATGGGANELRDMAEFIAKVRMNPRAIDTDTLLGLVRSGMPLRQTAEHMAGRKFENEQEATMFLQSRLSGRGARGIEELNRAQQELYGGAARTMGRTDLSKVGQRISESAQGVLLGTSEKGLNVALGGLNLLADMMGVLGKLNSNLLGVPGLLLLVSGFGYLKNGFMQAKASLDAFVMSLSSFSATVQTAQVRNAAASAMNVAGSIPMYLSPYAQMSGQMNPAFLAANQYVNGKWVPIPPPAPLTPMEKIKAGISSRMTAANAGLNNFFANMNPNMAGNLLMGGIMLGGMVASQSLATQQAQNQGNQRAMAESTRMQNALGGAASGAMLGNMIGTLFPGVGNIVGTIAGTLIGGAAGYLTSENPDALPNKALDENTKALNNATVAMTLLASSIIGAGPRAAGAVSAIELEMYMATRNNMMNTGLA